jgi:hypothetical protein
MGAISAEHVLRQNSDTYKDQDNPAKNLHFIAKERFKTLTKHDTYKGDPETDYTDDERRDKHCRLEHPETYANGKGIDAGGKRENDHRDNPDYFKGGFIIASPHTLPDHFPADNCEQDKRNPVIVRRDEPD